VLPKEAKLIEDYGQRIFRNPGFLRSMTPEEKDAAGAAACVSEDARR
jgi:hypothetical protein